MSKYPKKRDLLSQIYRQDEIIAELQGRCHALAEENFRLIARVRELKDVSTRLVGEIGGSRTHVKRLNC